MSARQNRRRQDGSQSRGRRDGSSDQGSRRSEGPGRSGPRDGGSRGGRRGRGRGRDGAGGAPSAPSRHRVTSGTFFRGATLVTFDPPAVEQADVYVLDGKIEAKGRRLRVPDDARVVEARGRILIPGLVDAYGRVALDPLRGLAHEDKLPLVGPERANALEAAHDEISVICASYSSALEALRAGVTCVFDHHGSGHFAEGSLRRVGDVLLTVGLRCMLGYRVSPALGDEALAGALAETRASAAYGGGEALRMAVASGPVGELGDEILNRLGEMAREFEVPVLLDLADQDGAVLDRLETAGLLGENTLVAHAGGLDEAARTRLGEAGAAIVHTPTSDLVNRRPATAIGPQVAAMGLGTGENPTDIFSEARSSLALAQGAGEAVGPERVLEMVAAGHRLASRLLGEQFGSFEPGAAADLVVLDYDPSIPLNAATVAHHLVFGFGPQHVESVMIQGRFALRERVLVDTDLRGLKRNLQRGALDFWTHLTGTDFPGYQDQLRAVEAEAEAAAAAEAAAREEEAARAEEEAEEEMLEDEPSADDLEADHDSDDEGDAEADAEAEPEEDEDDEDDTPEELREEIDALGDDEEEDVADDADAAASDDDLEAPDAAPELVAEDEGFEDDLDDDLFAKGDGEASERPVSDDPFGVGIY